MKRNDWQTAASGRKDSGLGLGHQTQYCERSKRDPQQQLVIGLDFGTAFTKVVIGETRVCYAVPFSTAFNGENKYLLPSVLLIGLAGECYLGGSNADLRRVADLKMRLLQGDYGITCQAEITAFLALVLRYCRAWLLNEHRKTYESRYLDWYVNVGLPTHSYHDSKLTNTYQSIVQAAWFTSILPNPITIDLVQHILESRYSQKGKYNGEDDDAGKRNIHPASIGLFPEFVAQVTGYVRSPLRRSDLHALMDVGAGTVDVTIFNVHEINGEDRYPIFAKSVEPFGAQYLILHRLKMSFYKGDWKPEAQDMPPPDSKFAARIGISRRAMRQIDKPFQDNIFSQVIKQLAYTRKRRYPLSRRWDEGIPLFLCGGGARLKFYAQLFASLEEGWPYKLKNIPLPKPERLVAKGLPSKGYDRLSVAYGLSFDALDIGEIQKADEVEDAIESDQKNKRLICSFCKGSGGARGNDCQICGGSGFF